MKRFKSKHIEAQAINDLNSGGLEKEKQVKAEKKNALALKLDQEEEESYVYAKITRKELDSLAKKDDSIREPNKWLDPSISNPHIKDSILLKQIKEKTKERNSNNTLEYNNSVSNSSNWINNKTKNQLVSHSDNTAENRLQDTSGNSSNNTLGNRLDNTLDNRLSNSLNNNLGIELKGREARKSKKNELISPTSNEITKSMEAKTVDNQREADKCVYSPYVFHRYVRRLMERLDNGDVSLISSCRYCQKLMQVLIYWEKDKHGRYIARKRSMPVLWEDDKNSAQEQED